MQNEFLSTALGLQGFFVVAIQTEQQHIEIELDREEAAYVCSHCGQIHLVYYDRYRIRPQDLPISGRRVYLRLWKYRVFCSCCDKAVSEHLPYIRPHAQMTKRFEQALHEECKETPVKAVAERHRLAWGTVRDVDFRFLKEKISRQSLNGLRWIGIDEIAHEKRHKYLTVVTDLQRRKVVRVLNERKAQSLTAFFKELGKEGCAKIECVVIDMWRPYRRAIRRCLKNALPIIDKFHVIKKAHEALDQVRKDEQAQLPPEQQRGLKGKRWLLLQSLQTTEKKERIPSLFDLMALNDNLAKAYLLKEEFREWYGIKPVAQEESSAFLERVKKELNKWRRHVHQSKLLPFKKVLQTIRNWRGPILNYFLTGLSNGLSEGINNVIKTIKKRAYGYRNKEYFTLKIYQKVGLI